MKALAVTAGIVFWTLVLGTAWLAFFPGSQSGEPIAILQIKPESALDAASAPAEGPAEAAEPGAEPSQDEAAPDEAPAADTETATPTAPAPQATKRSMDLPPGFAVTGPPAQPQAPVVEPGPGQGSMLPLAPAAPPSAPDDAAPSQDPDQQGAAPPSEETASTAANVKTAAIETPAAGEALLAPGAVPELVEESQYGPLPKVAADGRRPLEVYARPSRYASAAGTGGPPRIAVLITGLGLPDSPPGDVLKGLPATMSVAYAAYGRSLQDLVSKARAEGHEVLLQIPLEPNNYPTENPGPHTLLTSLPPEENLKRLQWLMSRYTGYVGVTNQMGAKFEAARDSFLPVLEEMKRRGLLFVDDGSVQQSAGAQIASTIGLDYSAVSVQIDAGASPADIAKQLARLEALAKEHGTVIGVAKARPTTIKQLADWAAKLEAKGFVLVPVSTAVRSQRQS